MAVNPRKVVVFSGGSAANSLVDVFNQVIENNNCSLTYVIPISDNGGSSSELIRVFGGPGIGDVRSMKPFSTALDARLAFALRIVHFQTRMNTAYVERDRRLELTSAVQCISAYVRFSQAVLYV